MNKILRVSAPLLVSILAFGATAPSAFAQTAPIINEFSSYSSSDWVEIYNPTSADVPLSGWSVTDNVSVGGVHTSYLSSSNTTVVGSSTATVLPAGGFAVVDMSNRLNVMGDLISLNYFDGSATTTLNAVAYGSTATSTVDYEYAPTPASGESAYRTTDGGATWAVTVSSTEGTTNVSGGGGSGGPDYATIFGTIKTTLAGQGIDTNIDAYASTPTACSGLYFEKTGKGRVTFSASLDLTNSATSDFLQHLGDKMDASVAGKMHFDARTATLLKNAGAEIKMYGLGTLGYSSVPNLIVRDDDGVIIPPTDGINYPSITGVLFSGGTLTFNTSHFTQFDVDNNIYVGGVSASDTNDGSQTHPVATIGHGIAIAPIGGTVNVEAGNYDIADTIIVNKAVTISGPVNEVTKLQGVNSANVSIFEITASNVTIQNLEITHNALPSFVSSGWAELPNSLIRIPSGTGLTGIAITDNIIYVPAQSGAMSTWNGVGITVGTGTTAGVAITGNTIYNVRDGVVVQYNNTATISNNIIHDTKGGVMNYTNNQADANNR